MSFADRLFGRRLASHEEEAQKIGPLAGIPMLGLDGLSSSAYGPEAALTLLLPLGALGVLAIVPITAVIIGVLVIVYFSYRQTIAATRWVAGRTQWRRRTWGSRPDCSLPPH
jgi:hypothetical protein